MGRGNPRSIMICAWSGSARQPSRAAPSDAVFDAYKEAIKTDITQLQGRKDEFNAFKLDALEIAGTALFDRIDRAFPLSEQMLDSSELERLLDECESLRRKLKLAAQEALGAPSKVQTARHLSSHAGIA